MSEEHKMDNTGMKSSAQSVGLSYDEVIAGLKRIMPIIETVSQMTENPYDDIAVQFLKRLLDASV